MASLTNNPRVIQLAKDLGLDYWGDSLAAIERHALSRVDEIVARSIVPVNSLDRLRDVLAEALSVNVRELTTDECIDQIADEFGHSYPRLRERLRHEFRERGTEGLLLVNPVWDGSERLYLAIVDRRGQEANRARFTAWHELSHLLIAPAQIPIEGLRRTNDVHLPKDPIEQVVDHIAGLVAFHQAFFGPAVDANTSGGPLRFEEVERVRIATAADASLHSTAIACVNHSRVPTLLIKAEMAFKPSQLRTAAQHGFDLGIEAERPRLRAVQCYKNAAVRTSKLRIQKNFRIPERSIIFEAATRLGDCSLEAYEDQSWWETSSDGPLPRLAIFVRVAKRGGHLYAMISPRNLTA